MKTNCLFWALAMFRRRKGKARRRYLAARWSDWGPFPHFLYKEMRRGRIRSVSYRPTGPRPRRCPPLLFQGRVTWGDK